jgi:hypothetical protein
LLPVIAAGPLATSFFASAPFTNPYLIIDTANKTIQGPGSMWFSGFHPRPGRTGASYSVRGPWIHESSARGERRLGLHRWWAHPGDWAEITALLADRERRPQPPPDWFRLGLPPAGERITFGINRKLFRWAFGIGLVVTMAGCLGLPELFQGPDFLRTFAMAPMVPLTFGLVPLLFDPVYTVGPSFGTVTVTFRLRSILILPSHPKYSHLEYSARLGNLYQVRTDGKRELAVQGWMLDPVAWKHFTDLIQERVR